MKVKTNLIYPSCFKTEKLLLEIPIVVVLTSAQFHSIKPGLRFWVDLNPACVVSEIRNGENILTMVP